MHIRSIIAADILSALSDVTRLRIMRTLAFIPEADVCLCELSDAFEVPVYNLSRHLKELRAVGLLDAEKEGRWIYHKISKEVALRPFYELLEKLPDEDGKLKEDISRLKKEIKLRSGRRCTKDGPARNTASSKGARSA
jgi:ArsR family transcriptional regulator, arsenate/arsenite/antimonite-responsive transcriptional repressor